LGQNGTNYIKPRKPHSVFREPQREILRVSKVLEEVGFNVQLLGSGNYVFQKLQALNADDLERVREGFVKADHPRFFKFFSSGLPFGHMGDYERKVNAATLEQLAGLIKICGFLMQTKVYLFWEKFHPRGLEAHSNRLFYKKTNKITTGEE
jgi:hypothetical protein